MLLIMVDSSMEFFYHSPCSPGLTFIFTKIYWETETVAASDLPGCNLS